MGSNMAVINRAAWRSMAPEDVNTGDILVGLYIAKLTPGTETGIPDGAITFRNCNLSRAVVKGSWNVSDNCNTSQQPLPEPEAPEQSASYDVEDLATALKTLAQTYPVAFATKFKNRFTRNQLQNALSADGDAVVITNPGGGW